MAQVLLMGLQTVCGIPGSKVVGPILLAINPISPINACVYVAWLLGLKLSKSKWTKKIAPTWKKAALWALLFYFVTALIIYFPLLFALCGAVG